MSYRVSTQVYSGPFDLLLQLVTRQKVDIGAISISEVAEQYLAEAERIEALDLDVASDFLLVAATLLDIKAASLVPQEAPRKVDDDDEFDEDLEELSALDGDALREVLIQRLIAYKQFKGAAAALGARMQAESRMHPRVAGPDPEFLGLMPDYLAGITLRGLAVICQKQQSFRVSVQSSYGVNASLYSSDKVCHNASVVLCFHGCYNASRLVKDKISLVRNFQMQSVSVAENAVSFRVNVLTDYCRFFVDKDLALTDKFLSRTP